MEIIVNESPDYFRPSGTPTWYFFTNIPKYVHMHICNEDEQIHAIIPAHTNVKYMKFLKENWKLNSPFVMPLV